MRLAIAILSMALALYSIALDQTPPALHSRVCDLGWCRFDQLYAAIDREGTPPANLAMLVNADSSNPMVWASYAERLAAAGKSQDAAAAFERAVALGPGIPAAQIRAVNFFFTHRNPRRAAEAARIALTRTALFDDVVFSYFHPSQLSAADWVETALPATPRAARAWMAWLRTNGSELEVRQSWTWARTHNLLDQTTVAALASGLWRRKLYRAASDLWQDWAKPSAARDLLANRDFSADPSGGPFDWTLSSPPSIAVTRANGLEVRFLGVENVGFWDIRQGTMVRNGMIRPGTYRFSAEIESEDITTDQCPYFHIVDPAHPEAVHAETKQICRTTPRSWITVDLAVPPQTEALEVILERQKSEISSGLIRGTLKIHQVSLVASPHT